MFNKAPRGKMLHSQLLSCHAGRHAGTLTAYWFERPKIPRWQSTINRRYQITDTKQNMLARGKKTVSQKCDFCAPKRTGRKTCYHIAYTELQQASTFVAPFIPVYLY
jgi:hypothetical protein